MQKERNTERETGIKKYMEESTRKKDSTQA